jgi:hypothetical protein
MIRRLFFSLVVVLGCGGCAMDIVSVRQTPATLAPVGEGAPTITLQSEITVSIGTGFATRLKKGTTWRRVGKIAEGDVYITRDQVVTVEASHIHEAQVVVAGNQVVGFYLPVERTFAVAKTPVPFPTQSNP